MNEEYKIACTEIYSILQIMPDELVNKIPSSIIEKINKYKNNDYKINVTLADIEEKNMKKFRNETITMLSIIYRDYIVDDETRKYLIKKEKVNFQKLNQKYDYNNLFNINKKEEIKEVTNVEESKSLIKYEKWYIKLLNKIKHFFK